MASHAENAIGTLVLGVPIYRDNANNERWTFWRIEGPGFVWNFRVLPHVHTFVNIGRPANA